MHKRLRQATYGVLIASAIVIAVLKTMPRDHLLLHRATPVASTARWVFKDPTMPNLVNYFWLSDQDVLFFQAGLKNGYQLFRQHIVPGGRSGVPVALPVKEINPTWRPYAVSPDGKWLAWRKRGALSPVLSPTTVLMETALDGSATVTHPPSTTVFASQRWLTEIGLIGINRPSRSGWVAERFHQHGGARETQIPLTDFRPTDQPRLLGLTPKGYVIASPNGLTYISGVKSRETMNLVLFDLKSGGGALRRLTLPARKGTISGGAEVSPDGDRLLWTCFEYETPLPIVAWFNRLLNRKNLADLREHSWWVSRLDGAGMHEIGRMAARDDDGGVTLHWMPDSKQVSFLYKGQLYTAPAD